jgi:uncharacterized cupredoxin-like copper-binding protein
MNARLNARFLALVTLASGCLVLGGCGGSAAAALPSDAVQVSGTDAMRFAPDTITAKAGQPVTLAFKNAGIIPHDLITEGGDKNARLVNVGSGKQQTAVFQANKPGTYAFVCNQPGHKEAGMVGKIVVS